MAFTSRLSRYSKELFSGVCLLQKRIGISVRLINDVSHAPPQALKGDELLKGIFWDVKNKFDTAVAVLKEEKITIDPDDPAAISRYADVMKMIREKAGLLSESQRMEYAIETSTREIPDARTYLLTLQEQRENKGLLDDVGAEAMMMEALEKVEKQIKKPLLRDDKSGMSLLFAEFEKINKKIGLRKEDLPKYEEKLELGIAKVQLEELKKEALDEMESIKKREAFEDEEIPDVKSLDVTNFL